MKLIKGLPRIDFWSVCRTATFKSHVSFIKSNMIIAAVCEFDGWMDGPPIWPSRKSIKKESSRKSYLQYFFSHVWGTKNVAEGFLVRPDQIELWLTFRMLVAEHFAHICGETWW